MATKVIVLKQNSREIREKISDAGIDVCHCAGFFDAVWLDFYPSVGNVHGLGYPYEGMTKEQTIEFIQYDWNKCGTDVIYCKDVDEFITQILKYKDGKESE